MHVGANPEIFLLECRIRAGAAAPGRAEGLFEDVLEAGKTAAPAAARAATAAPCRPGEAFRTKVEAFEIHVVAEPGARARPRAAAKSLAKALKARLAFGIDLAAVERLALVLVFEQFVRSIELGKARRRLGIVLVGVGMQLLG